MIHFKIISALHYSEKNSTAKNAIDKPQNPNEIHS